jgi:hypothetical protein
VTSTDKSDSLDTENSTVIVQATNHFGHRPKSLVLGAIRFFRLPAVLTVQGHCRNVGTDLRPDARPCSRNSGICRGYAFGELSAMTWLAVRTVMQAAAVLKHKSDEGVEMYSTTSLNGVPTIQRGGRNILGVLDQNWDFANEICDLLNSLDDDPHIFLTEHDRKWLKAMDRAFKKVQHA